MFGDFLVASAGKSAVREPQSPQPYPSTIGSPSPCDPVVGLAQNRPILRRVSPSFDASAPMADDAAVPLAGGSRKQSRRTTFVVEGSEMGAQINVLRPGHEASTPAVPPSTLFATGASSPSSSSPTGGKSNTGGALSPTVKKIRSQIAELNASNQTTSLSPTAVTIVSRGADPLAPLLRLPNDPLLDAQVAMLDLSMRGKMRDMEALLRKPLHRLPTKSDAAAEKFMRSLEEQRAKAPPEHVPQCLKPRALSPREKQFHVSLRVEDRPRITGELLRMQKAEREEAQRELERLERDPKLRAHRRALVAMERMQARAKMYSDMIADQEEQKLFLAKGHGGNQKTTQELINEWKDQIKDVEFTDYMLEQREKQRAIRKIEKEQRHRVRIAMAIMEGKDISSAFAMEPSHRDEKKRWRVSSLGSVDAFRTPRWSSNPVYVFPPDSILVEEETTKVGNITWVRALEGWVAVHVVYGGYSKTQLFADIPEGEGVTVAMLDEFDDSCEKVERAYLHCPPEALKSMDEMKDIIFQQEFARQIIRELPVGHHDIIKQTWEEMQRKSKLKLNNLRAGAGGGRAKARGGGKMNDDDSGDEEK
jgi:hypothetical protein